MRTTSQGEWTTEDYEKLSWHDNHVHGLHIREGEHGQGELLLDLDHIVEWLRCDDGQFQFRIAAATLTFHELTDLRLNLDYATPSAAMGPFSIHAIHRDVLEYPNGHTTFRWRIEVNWPAGSIEFVAAGFSQRLTGSIMRNGRQYLSEHQRSMGAGG